MGLWSRFKTGAQNFGSKIKSGIKQGAKWAWDHREGIGKVVGTGLDIAANLGVPGASAASKIVKTVSSIDRTLSDGKFAKGVESINKKYTNEPSVKASIKVKPIQKSQEASSNNYSINPRSNGGTRESRRYHYESFR